MKKSTGFKALGILFWLYDMCVYADAIPHLKLDGTYRYALEDYKQRTLNVNRPWFDSAQKLRWDESEIDTHRCETSLKILTSISTDVTCRVKTHFIQPRLDECRCEYRLDDHQTRVWQSFIGGEHNETWERHRCESANGRCAHLSDVTTSGIIFADHEVWSIQSGKTLFSAQKTAHKQHATSFYLASTHRFVEFDGESNLIASKGGLWIFDPHTNKKELIDPIDDGLFGYWKVEKISEIPNSGVLILVERWATRGLGDLRLKLFDLSKRKTLAIYKLSSDGLYSDIHIQHAKENQIAVSFFDAKAYVVVQYRVATR